MADLARLSQTLLVALAAVGLPALDLAAFERVQAPAPKPEMRENCPGLIASDRPRVMPAALRLALNSDQVRVTYAGHSTFLIESPQLVRVATDYNDYVRSPVLPDVPTMRELGLPKVNSDNWYALISPGEAPLAVRQKIHDIAVATLRSKDVDDAYAAVGGVAVGSTPEELATFLRAESAKWAEVITFAKVKLE